MSSLLKDAVLDLIEELGYNADDPNLVDTPDRVFRAWHELILGRDKAMTEARAILEKAAFPTKYTGVVLITNIEAIGMCPHHALPVIYSVSFAYLPNAKVVGVSKIPRFLKKMAKMLVLQEDLTEECLNLFVDIVKPKGAMLVLEGMHMCMRVRGVLEDSLVRTIGVRGEFSKLELKEEVLQSLGRKI